MVATPTGRPARRETSPCWLDGTLSQHPRAGAGERASYGNAEADFACWLADYCGNREEGKVRE